jgi:hypothetical protein
LKTIGSVDDYLAGKQTGRVKHEYIAGAVYAMAGGSSDHNQIAGNLYAAFRHGLHGGPCRAFILDFKVRLDLMGDLRGCDPIATPFLEQVSAPFDFSAPTADLIFLTC